MSDAKGGSYRSIASLDEARAFDDAIVVLEGDEGGQIYLVCPAPLVRCSEDALRLLLLDLDALSWNEPTSAHLCFEIRPANGIVAGGMGGGRAEKDLWLHPRLIELGIVEDVRSVLDGARDRIGRSS